MFRIRQAEDSLRKTQNLIEKAKEKGQNTKKCEKLLEKAQKALEKTHLYFNGRTYVPANYWALQAMKLLTECRECIKNL